MTCRSWLYCPGNDPGKITQAALYGADGIILDLEDSVAAEEKLDARELVAEALRSFDFGEAQLCVRINSLETTWWEEDLRAILRSPDRVPLVRIPKVESPETVASAAALVAEIERAAGRQPGTVRFQCIVETPRGVEKAYSIVTSSSRIDSVSFGAEDYCAQTGASRSPAAKALDFARSRLVNAAGAAAITVYDTVWGAFRDMEGLRDDAKRAREIGFDGKSAVHPDQVALINEIFTPSEQERSWAKRVIDAFDGEGAGSRGVAAVEGQMIDAPVVARARRILASPGVRDGG